MLHELHTVDSISAIEGDIHVDPGLSVLQFDNGHFSVLQGVYGLADPGLQELVRELVDHAGLLDIWLVNEEVDIRIRQVEPCGTRPEDHYTCVGIALPYYIFDSGHDLLADLQILWRGLDEFLEIQDLIVQEDKGVLDLQGEVTDPGVLISIVLLRDSSFYIVYRVSCG